MANNGNKGIDPVVRDIAIYGGGGLLAYLAIKNIFSILGQTFGDAPPPEFEKFVKDKYTKYVEFIRDVLGPSIKQKNLQYQRHFYKAAADALYKAMNGPGTDEDLVFNTLKGLNTDDLKTVYMDFGLRAPTVNALLTTVATGPRRDLIDWFLEDFSGNKRAQVMQIWKPTHLVPPGY